MGVRCRVKTPFLGITVRHREGRGTDFSVVVHLTFILDSANNWTIPLRKHAYSNVFENFTTIKATSVFPNK